MYLEINFLLLVTFLVKLIKLIWRAQLSNSSEPYISKIITQKKRRVIIKGVEIVTSDQNQKLKYIKDDKFQWHRFQPFVSPTWLNPLHHVSPRGKYLNDSAHCRFLNIYPNLTSHSATCIQSVWFSLLGFIKSKMYHVHQVQKTWCSQSIFFFFESYAHNL